MKNTLKIIRAERDLTQEQLALIVGISRSALNQIENGNSIPSGETMLLISKKLNLPIQKIFTDFVV